MTIIDPTHSEIQSEIQSGIRAALLERMHGQVLDPPHPDYDAARRVWNGVIDRHPAVIARCAGTTDVVEAVVVARRFRPVVSIRGGGHQVAGSAVCDDGLVIDLSAMRGVQVDPVARTARVQAGARWADVDRATQVFGLVAADGVVRTASRTEHPDLFWAARGGGRGLGVVTSFEFDLHPLGPQVATAQVFYPYEQAGQVLRAWRDLTLEVPETVAPEFVLWSIPPDPGIPAELHGQKVVVVAAVYAGDPADGSSALAPLAQLATPLLDASGTVPYVAVQSALDPAFPEGGRYYFKSHFMDRLEDDAIDAMLACDARRPNPQSLIVIRTLGGAIDKVSAESSSYPHRGARYNVSIDASWSDPAYDATALGWARTSWTALQQFATGGVYVNFAGLDNDTERAAVYGPNAQRLQDIRRAYDTEGVLHDTAARN